MPYFWAMKTHVRSRSGISIAGAMLLLASACGGDGDSAKSDEGPPDRAVESTSTEQDADTASSSLHESLAGFPLPPDSEIPYPASEYDDERGTVAQFVSVPLPHLEVATYLFAELPTAGYTVVDKAPGFATTVDDIDPEFGGAIYFENPDGVPGQVTLQVQGDKTGLNFNVFTNGDV